MTNRYGLPDTCTALPHIDTPGVCNRCGTALTGRRTQWCSSACESAFRAEHDWNAARAAALKRDGRRCVRCGGVGKQKISTREIRCSDTYAMRGVGIEWVGDRPAGWRDVVTVSRFVPWLEVNHIEPRCGGGYHWGCWNHQDNLETLCHGCHVIETNRQALERRGLTPITPQPSLFDEAAR